MGTYFKLFVPYFLSELSTIFKISLFWALTQQVYYIWELPFKFQYHLDNILYNRIKSAFLIKAIHHLQAI